MTDTPHPDPSQEVAVVSVFAGADGLDANAGNVDVEVRLTDDTRWAATFFTLANIEGLMDHYKNTGEGNSGEYFWAKNTVIVKTLTREKIEAVINDLISSGEFTGAFEQTD